MNLWNAYILLIITTQGEMLIKLHISNTMYSASLSLVLVELNGISKIKEKKNSRKIIG